MSTLPQLADRVDAQFPQTVEVLKSLVAIPSYAAPSAPPDVLLRSAERVADLLCGIGGQDVEIVQAGGGPGVIGQIWVSDAAPTVLLYAHHDVQPVANDWSTDPWEPVIKGDRLYGRGAADDGAGVALHVAALRALGSDLGVNVRFFIEGEEESGSPTFGALLRRYRDRLAADVVVIADSDNASVDVPALTVSLRGVTDVTVTLRIAEHAVHSGSFGGVVLDAPTLLARLIATLHDAAGSVCVEGLAPTGHTRASVSPESIRQGAGLVPGLVLAGEGSVADRLWWSPAIDLIGFDSTGVDESSNTIQPVARARLSLRVPPGMDPVVAQAALARHLAERVEFGASLVIEDGVSGAGFKADISGPAYAVACRALGDAFGQPVVFQGQGGSIPLAAELAAVFPGIEVLMTGVEDPDSRAHSGDESVSLPMLRKAVLGEALLLDYLRSYGAGLGAGGGAQVGAGLGAEDGAGAAGCEAPTGTGQ
ncbi:MAG: M20/M25/M40 family metallo-hydrolase [Bifidobacteriaceae bacterium]|jgi:acetylornithine deacetylase/succinyl-diaminopimelate desuccinylase-like protein|nr:M20/M25/M40 family metallo-hydrolase [Bifidobacteriaceae bacterium]